MINSPIVLDFISEILIKNVDSLSHIYPDLKISGCDLMSKSIWIENFEFIEGTNKINNIYSKGKLEVSIHQSGKKSKKSDLEDLITIISIRMFLGDDEPISFYKWESNKTSCLLKKEDRIVLMSPCSIPQAFKKTFEDIIHGELPKFRGDSKEKKLSDDQLLKLSSFNGLSISGTVQMDV